MTQPPHGDGRLPVLWLYGPAGVGKTTAAWRLFTQLARDGTPTGYVDIDQLGMCYAPPGPDQWAPEPVSDPGRYRMKDRNLDAVVANFRAAGARCAVVSGVVDAIRGVDAGSVAHAALTPCRLRCEPAELLRRRASRGRLGDEGDEELRYAEALDRNHRTDVCIDTTGRTVTEVLDLVRERTPGWPRIGIPAQAEGGGTAKPYRTPASSPGDILWLSGPTAVGKSTVGWHIYERVRRSGCHSAFVDLEQIGFHRPVPTADPGNHRLKAANLGALWTTFHARGARHLVVVGPVDCADTVRTYAAALPAATVTLCRLHAGRDQLTERVMLRGKGLSSWEIPGDELKGQSAAVLDRVADQAAAEAEALEAAGIGDLRIDTDGRPAPDIAQEILVLTGWPSPGRRVGGASTAAQLGVQVAR